MAGHGVITLSGVVKAQPPTVNRPLVGEAVAHLVSEGGSTPASRGVDDDAPAHAEKFLLGFLLRGQRWHMEFYLTNSCRFATTLILLVNQDASYQTQSIDECGPWGSCALCQDSSCLPKLTPSQYGNWACGPDLEILPMIDHANVACGFHAS